MSHELMSWGSSEVLISKTEDRCPVVEHRRSLVPVRLEDDIPGAEAYNVNDH